MAEFDPTTHPHRRYNPLTEEYVLVSPHRAKRPWLGQVEPPQVSALPQYDPACFLCPRNTRANGVLNPDYSSTYVFENDFAALLKPPLPDVPEPSHPLLVAEPVHGLCDVLVFHPRHDLTLAQLKVGEVLDVLDAWRRIYEERSKDDGINYVQVFENKGAMMGRSNPHPHSQVWSLSEIPTIVSKELSSLAKYSEKIAVESGAPRRQKGLPCLLCEYSHHETSHANGERIVVMNGHWAALAPWWAVWPYEILVLPYKRHIPSISHLSADEKLDLAQILLEVTIRYDNLFACSFAYSMGIHQAPTLSKAEAVNDPDADLAHLHLHFSPPLLRSASVRKFLVGFEMMAEVQRDLTPEQAASRLRACSNLHYLNKEKP